MTRNKRSLSQRVKKAYALLKKQRIKITYIYPSTYLLTPLRKWKYKYLSMKEIKQKYNL